MTVYETASFNNWNNADLASTPPKDEEPARQLNLRRRKNIDGSWLFDLELYDGDDDLTFYGLRDYELRRLGEHLIALSKTLPDSIR